MAKQSETVADKMEALFKEADAYDPVALAGLKTKTFDELKTKLVTYGDPTLKALQEHTLKREMKVVKKSHVNCDDISSIQRMFDIKNIPMHECIEMYLKLKHPEILVVSKGSSVVIRFHKYSHYGFSITSWQEIGLAQFPSPGRNHSDWHLTTDQGLLYGYDSVKRFNTYKEVCEEISRVDALLAERRKLIAKSPIMWDFVWQILEQQSEESLKRHHWLIPEDRPTSHENPMESFFEMKQVSWKNNKDLELRVWAFNDEGFHFEVGPFRQNRGAGYAWIGSGASMSVYLTEQPSSREYGHRYIGRRKRIWKHDEKGKKCRLNGRQRKRIQKCEAKLEKVLETVNKSLTISGSDYYNLGHGGRFGMYGRGLSCQDAVEKMSAFVLQIQKRVQLFRGVYSQLFLLAVTEKGDDVIVADKGEQIRMSSYLKKSYLDTRMQIVRAPKHTGYHHETKIDTRLVNIASFLPFDTDADAGTKNKLEMWSSVVYDPIQDKHEGKHQGKHSSENKNAIENYSIILFRKQYDDDSCAGCPFENDVKFKVQLMDEFGQEKTLDAIRHAFCVGVSGLYSNYSLTRLLAMRFVLNKIDSGQFKEDRPRSFLAMDDDDNDKDSASESENKNETEEQTETKKEKTEKTETKQDTTALLGTVENPFKIMWTNWDKIVLVGVNEDIHIHWTDTQWGIWIGRLVEYHEKGMTKNTPVWAKTIQELDAQLVCVAKKQREKENPPL